MFSGQIHKILVKRTIYLHFLLLSQATPQICNLLHALNLSNRSGPRIALKTIVRKNKYKKKDLRQKQTFEVQTHLSYQLQPEQQE